MTDDQIEWGDPPPPAGGPSSQVWPDRLAPFRDQPGVWGKLPGRWPQGTAGNIKAGKLAGSSGFDAVSRNFKDGWADIWVRYIGEGTT